MNYINNGEYYLIAKYPNGLVETININKKWYIGDVDQYSMRADISAIDIITTKFYTEHKMKQQMFKNKYIKNEEVDLFIAHKNKYKDKEYINEYEVIYKETERTDILDSLAHKRLMNEKITTNDTDELFNKFLTKSFNKKSFLKFMTSPWSKVDEFIKNKIISMCNQSKINYGIKYTLQDKMVSYLDVRNIISMWNIYDNLVNEYKNEHPTSNEEELGKGIINLYMKKLKVQDNRKEDKKILEKITDKNNIVGQITMSEYLEDTKTYEEQMQEMYDEEAKLKNSPIEDLQIRELVSKNDIEYVITHIDRAYLNKLSLEDRYRLGLITDYVEYKREKRNDKRHN